MGLSFNGSGGGQVINYMCIYTQLFSVLVPIQYFVSQRKRFWKSAHILTCRVCLRAIKRLSVHHSPNTRRLKKIVMPLDCSSCCAWTPVCTGRIGLAGVGTTSLVVAASVVRRVTLMASWVTFANLSGWHNMWLHQPGAAWQRISQATAHTNPTSHRFVPQPTHAGCFQKRSLILDKWWNFVYTEVFIAQCLRALLAPNTLQRSWMRQREADAAAPSLTASGANGQRGPLGDHWGPTEGPLGPTQGPGLPPGCSPQLLTPSRAPPMHSPAPRPGSRPCCPGGPSRARGDFRWGERSPPPGGPPPAALTPPSRRPPAQTAPLPGPARPL